VEENYTKIQWAIGAIQDFAQSDDSIIVGRARAALAQLKFDIADACAETKV
jgi:hypothetical protein